jgi:hypothetical protein
MPERLIAEIMAWEQEHVATIIRRYVDRSAATKSPDPENQRKANITCKTIDKTLPLKPG